MTESGGSTTQSGILYQNSVTALYLGRLLDVANRPQSERIEQVRAEAPVEVDDTVITFADSHQAYIQSKEHIQVTSNEWKMLWKHFDEQFRRSEFQRGKDRLLLFIGFGLQEHYELRDICERAANSKTAEEWQLRLSESQENILKRITPNLSPTGLTIEYSRELFAHIDVTVLPRNVIEQDRLRDWIPQTNRTQIELFRLLRDRVGGEARVKGVFTGNSLLKALIADSPDLRFNLPADIDLIRKEIQSCGSLLRQHQNTISGTSIHIKRDVVDKIVEWLINDNGTEKTVSLLIDQAGVGKTVIMRDVLAELDGRKIDVIAIKADQQLSNIKELGDIQKNLGLSYSMEQIVSRLAQLNRVIVLVDQIDALSLSLAHDQRSIDIILDLVARLRHIPNVRVFLSCRIFDWNTDPRFKSIEIGQTFSIPKFSELEIRNVFNALHVNYDGLTSATKELVATPLHLDLFARSVTNNNFEFEKLRGISSLQELYAVIWHNVVLRQEISSPPIAERVEVINQLTEYMDTRQRISVPQSMLQTPETQHLERAVNWLASMGILIRGNTEWSFLHQTFFDYSYARRFVEGGGDIVTIILGSRQGIFERPKLLQVIAYLRSFDHSRYIRDLKRLFNTSDLRYHLYDLLLHWFGALSNPTDDEWLIAQMMFRDDLRFPQFIAAIYGNLNWFQRVRHLVPKWLADNTRDTPTLGFLSSLVDIGQAEVMELLEPFAGLSDEWNDRIAMVIFHIRDWHDDSALRLYEKIVYKLKTSPRRDLIHLDVMCEKSPIVGCRIIKHLFEQAFNSHLNRLAQQGDEETASLFFSSFFLDTELRELEGTIEKAIAIVGSKVPRQYVETMLPWIEKVISMRTPHDDTRWFTADNLSYNWNDDTFNIQHAFLQSFIVALTQVALNEPGVFRPIALRLTSLPYKTPQLTLARVFQTMPDQYAEDAFNFLINDQRRFNLGEAAQFESRQIISKIFLYLSSDHQLQLETKILQYYWPIDKEFGLNALRRRGMEQYSLLLSIPRHLLSPQGLKRLREWQHKFPEFEIPNRPTSVRLELVTSPISNDVAAKMSNRSWLRAMNKFQSGFRHADPLRGGARELAGVLSEKIKNDPGRFHRLFEVVPLDIDDSYVFAFANGFVESDAPAEWTIDVFRRYANQEGRNVKRGLSYAIERLAKQNIPEDIISKLLEWVHLTEGEDESWWTKGDNNGSIYDSYLNSDRGSAFRALMRVFDEKYSEKEQDNKWKLIEFVANDSSIALRLGAIEELSYMIRYDRDKSWLLFDELICGHEILLETHQVRDFLYWSMYKNFSRLKPFIEKMIASSTPDVQEMGAELACIAAISKDAMESDDAFAAAKALASKMMTGQTSLRKGAANVYSFNMTRGSEQTVRAVCTENIRKLVNDEDDKIRNVIIQKFFPLDEEFFFDIRGLMEDIAHSSYYPINFQFADYLWKHGMLDSQWTLSIIRTLVSKSTQPQQWESGVEELMRFTLHVYTSASIDSEICGESLDIFDVLMRNYGRIANNILSEWDRR